VDESTRDVESKSTGPKKNKNDSDKWQHANLSAALQWVAASTLTSLHFLMKSAVARARLGAARYRFGTVHIFLFSICSSTTWSLRRSITR
jgi:hypothetical protein